MEDYLLLNVLVVGTLSSIKISLIGILEARHILQYFIQHTGPDLGGAGPN